MKYQNLVALTLSTAFLAACGGGDGGTVSTTTGPAASTGTAEGFWIGTTASGYRVNLFVLENGETWGLYGSPISLVGAIYGNTSSSGTSLSGSITGFDFVNHKSATETYTGSFTPKGTINFVFSGGTKFSATSYYSAYDQSIPVANLAGTYAGVSVTGSTAAQRVTVIIDSNGNVTSSSTSGSLTCATSGKATPRATGKNIFNLQLTFSGNACAFSSGTVLNGIANYDSSNGVLIAMGLNSDKSDGLVFMGGR